ncbi:sugar ABC transporter permease [Caproiciproducens galactitolivorans]|uniref:Sugar ABC transporter permease n=1 Tax=Caproiciproducens galactitolivorans TaxID=642589 RepID=A0ABT4BS80_9FIRM|nr:sugar ABC transporter permease [Caproiciproducens galactitolivorans]MCY1713739.1 sugar ABC transporter permease [Caproiciproducens galactitolivorans]
MKGNLKRRNNENITGFLFILPALLPLVLFWIIPLLYSFFLSFTNWDMMTPEIHFVKFYNYTSLLKDPAFYKTLLNTLTFAVGTTIPSIILGLLIAMALNGTRRGTGIYRTVIFAPYITPMVAVSIVWSWIFEPRVGLLNFVLSIFGLPKLNWLQSADTAMLSVIIVTVWKQLGWIMIFYLQAIRRVPKSLLEAATIDGAGVFSKFFKITIPLISPTTFFLIIISTINSLQAYDQIQVLTQGGPAGATRTMLYYYYQEAFEVFNAGKASAIAVFLVILTVIFSLIETAVSKKTVHYN